MSKYYVNEIKVLICLKCKSPIVDGVWCTYGCKLDFTDVDERSPNLIEVQVYAPHRVEGYKRGKQKHQKIDSRTKDSGSTKNISG